MRRFRRRVTSLVRNIHTQPQLVRLQVPHRQTWFGYYDLTPFDREGLRVLAMVGERWCRTPQPGDKVQIGYFDISDPYNFQCLGDTTTWCWQQGCRLRWWPPDDGVPERVFYNRLVDSKYGSVIVDLSTGSAIETFNFPVYDADPRGERALTLNFSRVQRLRPGYGYVGLADTTAGRPCPDDDGVWDFELATGRRRLLASLRAIASIKTQSSMQDAQHYVNHLSYSPGGGRMLFFHLWMCGARRHCRMIVGDRDGQNLKVLQDEGMISHFDWRDENTIVGTVHLKGKCNYYVFDLLAGSKDVFGEGHLVKDGHPSYGIDHSTLLTDTYPDIYGEQHLMLYHPDTGIRDLGRYFAPSRFRGEWRCDLHPRWNHNGRRVAFDSTHEGWRALYVLDLNNSA